ncbi:MAG: hypothetical protein IK092_04870 [Muribaculaceae bacterium]|nr:hypothetical protein [Muribaculaceae bacterium]
MKKFYIIITLAFICAVGFGQDRVNRVKLSFGNEGAILSNITGWGYDNAVGEWVDCDNFIEYRSQYKQTATQASWMSHEFNNIISLQFKTITYKENPYYVLIWEKWDGEYDYPNIHEDWNFWKTKVFLMFSQEKMDELKNITNNPKTIKVPITSKRGRWDKSADVDVIQSSMERRYQTTVYFTIYKATNGSIRFIFEQLLYYNESGIDRGYFEICESDFLNLINVDI